MRETNMRIGMRFTSSDAIWCKLRRTRLRIFTARTNQQWRFTLRYSYVVFR